MSRPTAKSLSLLPNNPELVFGLVGPLGTDLASVEKALARALSEVDYRCEPIKLSEHAESLAREILQRYNEPPKNVLELLASVVAASSPTGIVSPALYQFKMDVGNTLRKLTEQPDAMAILAVMAIRKFREDHRRPVGGTGNQPISRQAYVVHQLKRPEEVETLRRIYGDSFFLLGVYSEKSRRIDHLANRFSLKNAIAYPTSDKARPDAERLVLRDAEEDGNKDYGQAVRQTFALADAFIDGDLGNESIERSVSRLVRLLFWHPSITPTQQENAMFLAQGAALRSADLGRQVGAAVTTKDGQILSLGCNEVAVPGGGLAWGNAVIDSRDVGYQESLDTNTTEKLRILSELLSRLQQAGLIDGSKILESDSDSLLKLAKDHLKDTRLMGLIEFLRPVHAEMAALMDACRRGILISDAVLYVTTFPCHECAKHIIASGIRQVVFIEPYPKSQVETMFKGTITTERKSNPAPMGVPGPIPFEAFIGVSPRRYQALFAMPGKLFDANGRILLDGRRDGTGRILDWAEIQKRLPPKLAGYFKLYQQHENDMILSLEESIKCIGTS